MSALEIIEPIYLIFGYQSLPAQIIGVIDRDHLFNLPLVRNGDFTLK